MMVGIPGSGKSFWIKKNISSSDYTIICPDAIRKTLTGRFSDLTKDKSVWKLAKKRAIQCLINKKNVILDATNLRSDYRLSFIKDLPSCKLMAKRFIISPEEAKVRIELDIKEGKDRAYVPDHVIDEMYEKFITQSTPEQLKKEGFKVLED